MRLLSLKRVLLVVLNWSGKAAEFAVPEGIKVGSVLGNLHSKIVRGV